MEKSRENTDDIAELSHLVVRIQAGVLALVFAVIGGFGVFLMTAWLLVKGGQNVGSHLQLLGQYFIGYSVSWTGSMIGFLYGAFIGGVVGWCTAKLYNLIARARQSSRED